MKKKLLLWSMLICIFAFGNAQIDFPDGNFKNALLAHTNPVVDTNGDGGISIAEAEAVTSLSVSNMEISDLSGIEHFVNLQTFVANKNKLTSVDFSSNMSLEILYLTFNDITQIDISDNIKLTDFYIGSNELPSIDVTNNINLTRLHIHGNDFTEVNLLKNVNLTELNIGNNRSLTGVNISNNKKLIKFYCAFTDLTSIDLSQNEKLETLFLNYSRFENVDISHNKELKELALNNSIYTNIDLSENTKLIYLGISDNDLTEIDLTYNTSLVSLDIRGNDLTEIELSNQLELRNLTVSGNNLTTLDVRNCVLTEIYFGGNPNLKTVFMAGQPLEYSTNDLDEEVLNVGLSNCTSLEFICAKQEYLNDIYGLLEDAGQTDVQLSNDCDDPHNRIQGNITFDLDNDGCGGADDVPFNEVLKFTASPLAGGDDILAYSNEEGEYTFHVSDETYSFVPVLENTTYFTINPPVSAIPTPIAVPEDLASLITDYCIQPLGNFNDLEISIFPTSEARPGFSATYLIRYKNIGTTVQSGTATLDYEDDVLTYVSSTPSITSDNNGQLTWSFNDLVPMETVEIPLTLILNTPMDSPALNGGEILNFIATITAGEDETPENNVMELAQLVVNSYDPNDKTCLEGDILDPDDVGGYLHYQIRFENEGTADAINIRITDVIDTTKFNIDSFVPLKSSHSYSTTITNGNEIEFTFSDINLPFDDENNDGYVVFKIKTLDSLVEGDEIVNSAAIYFDFNFPIITEDSVVKVEKVETEETCEIIDLTDADFKEALINHSPTVDTNSDGEISICEAEAVSELTFTEGDLNSIDEINYFVNLESFSSYGNDLGDVSFNENINLKNIVISGTELTSTYYYSNTRTDSVDLSNNTALESLVLVGNNIENIDLSNKPNLVNIQLSYNDLEVIDLSKNILLKHLNISGNDIEILDLSNNTILTDLNISETDIEVLDCSNSFNLKNLEASACRSLIELNASVNSLSSLNIDGSTNLETLYMKGDHEFYDAENFENFQLDDTYDLSLVCIDPIVNFYDFKDHMVSESSSFSYESHLVSNSDCSISDDCEIISFINSNFKDELLDHANLAIDTNDDGEISICEAEAVSELTLTEEYLRNIDEISYFINLTSFSSYGNTLRNVNFTNNTSLKNVVISGVSGSSSLYNETDSVDLSSNTALESLVLIGNDIENVDLSNKPNLVNIQLKDNNLRSLDVSTCTSLVSLEVNNDNNYYLDAIDVSNNALLKHLNIIGISIEALDLSNNTILTGLNISGTDIEVLDLLNNTVLTDLNISETDIEILDIHNNILLTGLNISGTDIEVLDCSNSPNLKSLDVSLCTSLIKLDASVNSLSNLNIAGCRDLETLYMKGDHEFYRTESFGNFELGGSYDLYDLEIVCIDPITNFDEFEDYMNSGSYYFNRNGSLNSSTTDCNPVSSNDFNDYFTVYPNPATSYFFVKSIDLDESIEDQQIYDLTIRDFSGRTIDYIDYSDSEDFRSFSDYISIGRYNLAPGIYYLIMNTEVGQFTSSFVKN